MKVKQEGAIARKMLIVIALAAAVIVPAVILSPEDDALFETVNAAAEEQWRQEFDDICEKTQDAMSLSIDELKSLAARADRLLPVVESLGDTERRVFGKRLRKCRDLYLFVIDEKLRK